MKKLATLLFFSLIVLFFAGSGCQAPGKIIYENQGGKWRAKEVVFERENVTPGELKDLQDRLNGD